MNSLFRDRRSLNDPRVREVMRLLDDVLAIDAKNHDLGGTKRSDFSEGIVDSFYRQIVSDYTVDDWPNAAIVAVIHAVVLHAPEEDLKRMVRLAREELVMARASHEAWKVERKEGAA